MRKSVRERGREGEEREETYERKRRVTKQISHIHNRCF